MKAQLGMVIYVSAMLLPTVGLSQLAPVAEVLNVSAFFVLVPSY